MLVSKLPITQIVDRIEWITRRRDENIYAICEDCEWANKLMLFLGISSIAELSTAELGYKYNCNMVFHWIYDINQWTHGNIPTDTQPQQYSDMITYHKGHHTHCQKLRSSH
jgi:hypothetical protein